ncbi:uncharacterized protein LOC132715416 [Ruditapes philippinarum]|uniref:uncharacterized protein LOC132715416 n=1 Tax=Ruditapes philippinarum TaxID=129788 RepID=UPI00295A70CF|nr:uncharacterized protein LOC132715416 [Ruditapes philippinarum]
MYLYVNLIVLGVGFFIVGVAASDCSGSATDVCNRIIPEIPNVSTRDPTYVMTNETSHWKFCDVYSINTSQWYSSETRMSTSCPSSMYMCGTKFPIWMNGKNPEPEEGVMSRTSCLRDFDSCCLNTYKLTAVNCGEFMAYCFIDLPSSCHQRYCFDKREESTTGSKQTTTQARSTASALDSTTEMIYPSTTIGHESSTHSSAGVKYTSTKRDSSSLTTTTVTMQRSSGRSTEVEDTTTNGDTLSKTKEHESSDANNELLIIAISVIGLMTAVICGLIIFIIWRRRMPKDTEDTDTTKVYETLKLPDDKTTTTNEGDNTYRIVSFDSLRAPVQLEGKLGDHHGSLQTYKSYFSNDSYQLTKTEKELKDEDEHYVTLP